MITHRRIAMPAENCPKQRRDVREAAQEGEDFQLSLIPSW
jgi:hypothetical protein